jgi:HSP20 family molecular chaperone IbpA
MTFVKFKNAGGQTIFPSFPRGYNFPSFFNDSLERVFTDESSNWIPPVNIKERSADFNINLAVPGMDKQNFKIKIC